jgi:hypothetical protein
MDVIDTRRDLRNPWPELFGHIEPEIYPGRPLHVYRGDTLALLVHSIGDAAQLEINGDGTGFRRLRKPDAASPMRKSGGGRQ